MRFFNDLKEYAGYAKYAAKSALNAEVAGSYLNWFWWIFDPVCMMLIYTFIFGYVFRASEPNFPIFVFVGLTMWTFFNNVVAKSTKLIKSNKAIVSKVYLPKFILLETEIFVNFFKMLFSWGIIIGMLIFWQVPFTPKMFVVIPLFVVECLFTFGLCCLVMHFGVFVEDLANVVRIILRFVFYATGIFYSIETRIPNEFLRSLLLHCNPMAFLIASFRRCLLYETLPEWEWLLLWTVVSIILCVIGIRLIYKYENSYVKAI